MDACTGLAAAIKAAKKIPVAPWGSLNLSIS
jgi:hypothetical protein